MKTPILTALQLLEKQHNIHILLAVESGSRAWGFPSPDSDQDVQEVLAYCQTRAADMPTSKGNSEALNQLFSKTVKSICDLV